MNDLQTILALLAGAMREDPVAAKALADFCLEQGMEDLAVKVQDRFVAVGLGFYCADCDVPGEPAERYAVTVCLRSLVHVAAVKASRNKDHTCELAMGSVFAKRITTNTEKK
ncbi:MAG: hypothetical protein E6G97_17765 [Alphaproteobacteria bacterium]|nr:MAG: hypothetical protein E6G97_17765 [Alphaproteobacteria bacterium]